MAYLIQRIEHIDYRDAHQGCDSIKRRKGRTQGRFGCSISVVIVKCFPS